MGNHLKLFLITFFIYTTAQGSLVESYLGDDCKNYGRIYFCGEDQHFENFQKWMIEVLDSNVGSLTMELIEKSPNRLLIRHSSFAVSSGGKTLAPLSSKLTNGIGDDIVIEMNFEMPDSGSHLVPEKGSDELIAFTAAQNLMHELSHAQHKMNGTWAMMDSEGQAIVDENQFRVETTPEGVEPRLRNAREYGEGIQIWPEEEKKSS